MRPSPLAPDRSTKRFSDFAHFGSRSNLAVHSLTIGLAVGNLYFHCTFILVRAGLT